MFPRFLLVKQPQKTKEKSSKIKRTNSIRSQLASFGVCAAAGRQQAHSFMEKERMKADCKDLITANHSMTSDL